MMAHILGAIRFFRVPQLPLHPTKGCHKVPKENHIIFANIKYRMAFRSEGDSMGGYTEWMGVLSISWINDTAIISGLKATSTV